MVMETKGMYTGSESKVSSKGNKYDLIGFASGGDLMRLMVPQGFHLPEMEIGQVYKLIVDFNGRFKQFNLKEVVPTN